MESEKHMNYVRVIASYIKEHFPQSEWAFMEIDLPESTIHPSHVINQYRPDIYVSGPKVAIIGEAKTDGDTKNKHTRAQIISYVQELRTYEKEKHLILCTSLLALPELKNEVRRLHQEHDFSGIHIHCMNDVQLKTSIWDL